MLWLVDTSVWSRRRQASVAAELEGLALAGDQLAISSPVLLELLRGPQGATVATERQALTLAMPVIAPNRYSFDIAADIMVSLAQQSPVAHRLPLADLVTAAVAHQHGAGVIHVDSDFELIAQHGGVDLRLHRCSVDTAAQDTSPALRQRQLKREIAQMLRRLPIEQAEGVLEDFHARLGSMA